MFLADENSNAPLEIGGPEYAVRKLLKWKAEGPTERNKQIIQFLLKRGRLSACWSHGEDGALLLINLALDWEDFSMWQQILKKSASEGYAPCLTSDMLFRAWDVFTFDRTKEMFVHSTLASIAVHSLIFVIECTL